MITQKPQQDRHTDTNNEANSQSEFEKHGADIPEKESDNTGKTAAPTDKGDCAVKEVAGTSTTVTPEDTETEREPLIMQHLVTEKGTKEEGTKHSDHVSKAIEQLYNNV